SLGGHLATIDSPQEADWIRQTFGDNISLWIGLNDRDHEGQFVWSSGVSSSYRNFAPGEPNNYLHNADGEDYIGLNFRADGSWNDFDAGAHLWGLIEIQDNAPTRPAQPLVRSATL